MPEHEITQLERNLLLLQDIIPSDDQFFVWCYNRKGHLIASSCPQELQPLFEESFLQLVGQDALLSFARDKLGNRPKLLGSSLGLQWAICCESNQKRKLLFLLGPVFSQTPSPEQIQESLRPFLHQSSHHTWAKEFNQHYPWFPVMPFPIFLRYIIIVHNVLTGEQIAIESIDQLDAKDLPQAPPSARTPRMRDRNKVYQAEKALLAMVREGDLNYDRAYKDSLHISSGIALQAKHPLRHMKTNLTIFITLISRAAMEGGLSPEIAYSLGDYYIQTVEDCNNSGELISLGHAMYRDFILRVHQLHANPSYSHAIQRCCDFIDLHLHEKIKTADLANLVGYSEYYLTQKFKEETGSSLAHYIREVKVKRARLLLESSELSIREIAEELSFGSVNYFIKSFRDSLDLTPAQYRRQLRQK